MIEYKFSHPNLSLGMQFVPIAKAKKERKPKHTPFRKVRERSIGAPDDSTFETVYGTKTRIAIFKQGLPLRELVIGTLISCEDIQVNIASSIVPAVISNRFLPYSVYLLGTRGKFGDWYDTTQMDEYFDEKLIHRRIIGVSVALHRLVKMKYEDYDHPNLRLGTQPREDRLYCNDCERADMCDEYDEDETCYHEYPADYWEWN